MKNVSNEFRRKIISNREFFYQAKITFVNGNVLNLTDKSDLMNNGISISMATSGTDSFDIGAAVIGELILTLNNSTGKFDKYDFLDAQINLKIGLKLENSVEYLQMGIYFVDEAQTADTTIVLSALDKISQLEKPYRKVKTIYPASLYQIVGDICKYCNITLFNAKFAHSDMIIANRTNLEELSCLEVISYVAQVAGCYVAADEWGRLVFKWYDTKIFENASHLDGGTFKDYQSGDLADGGTFKDYQSGDLADGGTFLEQREFAHIYSISSMALGTDEIIITGIRVIGMKEDKKEEQDAEEREGYLFGEEGYVLTISENPLILVEMEKDIATFLGRKIIGMKIRTFSVNAISDPSIEAGDCAYISDRKGNSYPVYITNLTFKLGDYEEFSCGLESPGRNRASSISANTKAIIAARKEIQKQLTTYDHAVQQLTNLIANSFGVFKTEEVQEDHSIIYYLHNKPELSSSSIIWKMTADAFAVSSDGGTTWNAGIDANGNAIVNILNVIGIHADWINGGSLTLGGEDNKNGVCYVKDASGKTLVFLNKDGISFAEGAGILWENVKKADEIVTRITKDTIDTKYINTLNIKAGSVDAENISGTTISGKNLTLGGENNANGVCYVKDASGKTLVFLNKDGISFAEGAGILWENVKKADEIVTRITKDTIDTKYINTLNIKAGSVDAENISGTTISGKNISGGLINGTEVQTHEISVYETLKLSFPMETRPRTYSYAVDFLKADWSVTTIGTEVIRPDAQKMLFGRVAIGGKAGWLEFLPPSIFSKEVQFEKPIHTKSNLNIYEKLLFQNMSEDYTVRINAFWAGRLTEQEEHGLISLDKTGLKLGIGWSGVASIDPDLTPSATVLNLNCQTVKAPNVGGITIVSDERLKNSFQNLDVYENAFMDLKPCSFKYNHGKSGRIHFGFGANQVKETLEKHGFTTKDFAGFVQMSENEDSEDYQGIKDPMGLIYTEFVSWNTHMLQKTIRHVKELEKKIICLEEEIERMKESINLSRKVGE